MVELMVVVIIVAILAAAAIPLYTANVKKAIRSEAIATLGAIRSAEKIYKAEFGGYSNNLTAAQISGTASGNLGVDSTDAHYFDASCYTLVGNGNDTFTATCTSSTLNNAPAKTTVQKAGFWPTGSTVATMDQLGNIVGY